jgi:hypothetical protein
MIYEYVFTGDENPVCVELEIYCKPKSIIKFRGKKYIIACADVRENKTIILCLQFKNKS